MALAVMLNNFLHDLFAAWWMVSALLIHYSLRVASGPPCSIQVKYIRFLCSSMAFSLAGVVVFGAVRLWAYRRYEWLEAAGAGQVELLAVKHALFAAVLVAGFIQWKRGRAFLREAGEGPFVH